MKISKIETFATSIQKFYFSNEEIKPLLDEVINKKEDIKKTSYFYNVKNEDYGKEYYTDFNNSIKLYEYEKLMFMIGNFYQNKYFNVLNYWSALYYENSWHETHAHSDPKFNFSSILYLTNNTGGTTFYSPNLTSETETHFEASEVGKLVIFPSSLFHSVYHKDNSERIIISSNISII